jgi:MFS superfamily sulfate permease-like transporter
VIVFRPEASLIYVNADAVLESVLNRLAEAAPSTIRLMICDLSAAPYLDLAGSRMLHQLHTELTSQGLRYASSVLMDRRAIYCEPMASRTKSEGSTVL